MALAWTSPDDPQALVEVQRWSGLAKAWTHLVAVDGEGFVDMSMPRRQQVCYRVRWAGSTTWSSTQCVIPKS